MAREKVTITLDRDKARTAMTLTASGSMSDAVDVALDRLISAEQLRRDVAAYSTVPLTREERALGSIPVQSDLDDDDVDYDAMYGNEA
jgi:hypothetical protein